MKTDKINLGHRITTKEEQLNTFLSVYANNNTWYHEQNKLYAETRKEIHRKHMKEAEENMQDAKNAMLELL